MDQDDTLLYGGAVDGCPDYTPLAPVTAGVLAGEETEEESGCDSCRHWLNGRCQARR